MLYKFTKYNEDLLLQLYPNNNKRTEFQDKIHKQISIYEKIIAILQE
jgi:hypothetical protein